MSDATSLADGPNADIEIAVQRKRLLAMDLRWNALIKQLRVKDSLKKLPASVLLREIRELEASTAREVGAIGAAKASTPSNMGVIIVTPKGSVPEIPVASIVTRGGRENWPVSNDNRDYHNQKRGENDRQLPQNGTYLGPAQQVPGARPWGQQVADARIKSAPLADGAAANPATPPYTPFAEGAPAGDPMGLRPPLAHQIPTE